jgi:coenzyme F420 hydrogenase subunit beta
LPVCPGYGADARLATGSSGRTAVERELGVALEIWEGYAADPAIRYRGSSGGVLSALAIYCLEREDMGFLLHTGMDEERPWLNRTVTSRTRTEVLSRAGSRYAPASPCEGLGEIEKSDRPCVFIGKPSDTMAAWKARQLRPQLDRNLGLVLTFFCAGEPNTHGTVELLESLQIRREQIESLHYRGEGWPGSFRVVYDHGQSQQSLPYSDSWARLAKHRQFRWQLDPDGMGNVADISCGDAWESFNEDADAGRSLVIVRTPRGKEVLRRAIEAGYLTLRKVGTENVLAAQPNLLERRREIFGRMLAMRLLLLPTPRLQGFSLFHSWVRLPIRRQVRSVLGTLRRIVKRGLWRRQRVAAVGASERVLSPAITNAAPHETIVPKQ